VHAPGALDRFGDERRDVLRADLLDQRRDAHIVQRNPGGLRDQRPGAVALAVEVQSGDARAEGVQAVIGELAAQDHGLARPSRELPVPAGQLACHVDGIGAAGVEDDLCLRDRRQTRQSVGEDQGSIVREASEDVVRLQLLQLLVRGAREVLAAVADVRVPQSRGSVEQPAPSVVTT
jgi:hypothetical protein